MSRETTRLVLNDHKRNSPLVVRRDIRFLSIDPRVVGPGASRRSFESPGVVGTYETVKRSMYGVQLYIVIIYTYNTLIGPPSESETSLFRYFRIHVRFAGRLPHRKGEATTMKNHPFHTAYCSCRQRRNKYSDPCVPPRCIVRARRTVSDHHERLDSYVNMTGGG